MTLNLVDELFSDYAEMSGFILTHDIPEDRVRAVIGDVLLNSYFSVYCHTTREESNLPMIYHTLLDPDKVHSLLQGRIKEFKHFDKVISLKIRSDVE